VSDASWAIAILLVAIVLEAFSLRTAVHESRAARRAESWWTFVRRVKIPELPVVLLEDTGALVGLAFALFGVGMAELTGNARWDAVGSLAIGTLLVAIALVLAVEMKSFLIGESAGPDDVAAICEALESTPGVARIVDLRTEHVGPDSVLVVGRITVDPDLDAEGVSDVVDGAKRAIRARVDRRGGRVRRFALGIACFSRSSVSRTRSASLSRRRSARLRRSRASRRNCSARARASSARRSESSPPQPGSPAIAGTSSRRRSGRPRSILSRYPGRAGARDGSTHLPGWAHTRRVGASSPPIATGGI
jgi:hypothetical protein